MTITDALQCVIGLGLGAVAVQWLGRLSVLGGYSTHAQHAVDLDPSARSDEALLADFARLLRTHEDQLTRGMNQHLQSVHDVASQALRVFDAQEHSAAERRTVREALQRIVPGALGRYLVLPRAFRESAALLDGQTAAASMSEQLARIDRELKQILEAVCHRQSLSLLEHKLYLRSRFPDEDRL